MFHLLHFNDFWNFALYHTQTVCRAAFESSRTHAITPLVVTDKMAVAACLFMADNHRILVEPSCGLKHSIIVTLSLVTQ